jgi:RNA polymerase sigma factor (sigma-70 family)
MMKREDLLNKLVEKGNAAPIYISEITNVYPVGSEEFNYIQQELDASDVELIDDSKELDEGLLEKTEELDASNIDFSDLPFKGNLVSLYLKDIAPYPILSLEEEQELFSLVEKGKNAEEKLIKSITGEEELSKEEFEAYEEIAHVAEDARARIINCNLRLVVYNAKYYNNRGLAFMDLVQEGSMGLMVAVNKFDYKRGFKFSTYATAWIRQAISRSFDTSSRTIRVPSHIIEKYTKIIDATRRLSQELSHEPSDEEIAEYMHEMGFELKNSRNWTYATPDIYLSDMHDENVIRSKSGTIFVVDCDIRINTPELRQGGRRVNSTEIAFE